MKLVADAAGRAYSCGTAEALVSRMHALKHNRSLMMRLIMREILIMSFGGVLMRTQQTYTKYNTW